MKKKRYGLVLCSGGIDSVTTAHYVRKKLQYDKLLILFFNYGQKCLGRERKCARLCASRLKGKFVEIRLPALNELSTSLITKDGKVKRMRRSELQDARRESAKWYVPFRNTIFIAHALALVEKIYLETGKKCDIFVGFKYEGGGGFPDTSENFVNDIERVGRYWIGSRDTDQRNNFINIRAPLIKTDKADVVLFAKKLGVRFEDTFSCYIGRRIHCGYCLACRLRQEGFYWANVKDLTRYGVEMRDFRLAR